MNSFTCSVDGCSEMHTRDEFLKTHPGLPPVPAEPQPDPSLEVTIKRDMFGESAETVTAESPEARDHWDDRIWRPFL